MASTLQCWSAPASRTPRIWLWTPRPGKRIIITAKLTIMLSLIGIGFTAWGRTGLQLLFRLNLETVRSSSRFRRCSTYSNCLNFAILPARYVFWVDCCEPPHIGRIGMDGRGQTVIIDPEIYSPTALTIDYTNKRLYWADDNHILLANMDGTQRRKGEAKVSSVSGISLTCRGSTLWSCICLLNIRLEPTYSSTCDF